MQTTKIIHTVSCHAEGEVGDVIVGGVAPPPGETLWEQSRWLANDNTLRNFLLKEPRGGVFRHVNLLVPAKNPAAQMGFLIMEPEDNPPMSGSNSICVATVLLESGILPMQEPETHMTLEAPGGLIQALATCRDGHVELMTIHNVPSFAHRLDASLEVEGLGTLTVDTAYGGDSFVIVDAEALGFTVTPDEARDLVEVGIKITHAATEQLGFSHPEHTDWQHISFCLIAAPLVQERGIYVGRHAVTIRPGKLDRCPTGTGCSARLAVMKKRGLLQIGAQFIGESIIGSRFHCRLEAETHIGDLEAVIPSISGRAWVTGTHQHMLDPRDPWPEGYKVADTWPAPGHQCPG